MTRTSAVLSEDDRARIGLVRERATPNSSFVVSRDDLLWLCDTIERLASPSRREQPSEGGISEERCNGDVQRERDIAAVLNRHSAENGSNTPDFILAQFLMLCLGAFEQAVNARTHWYGGADAIGGTGPARLAPSAPAPCSGLNQIEPNRPVVHCDGCPSSQREDGKG